MSDKYKITDKDKAYFLIITDPCSRGCPRFEYSKPLIKEVEGGKQ